jgi:hypothetical protein
VSTTDGRNETATERLDRNWGDLLQELRVIQTGVQLLTGFLLTLPFQQRFVRLTHGEKAVYLATAAASIAATVDIAHRLAIVGMMLLAIAVIGVSCLITAAVTDLTVGTAAGGSVLVVIVVLWIALPLRVRRTRGGEPE